MTFQEIDQQQKEFAYFILAIVVFARIFKVRYLQGVHLENPEKKNPKNGKKKVEIEPKEIEKNSNEKSFITSFSELIIKICVFFLKFIAICILFGVSIYLIGMSIILVICIYLLIQGVTYFGFYLVMLSLFFLGIIFFSILFNFVLDRRSHGLQLAISLIISFTLLGVGCGVATVEVANTEFINSPPSDIQIETMQEELVMNEDTIFIGNISDYKVDNSLENVLIEYRYYPLGNKMATNKKNDVADISLFNFDNVNYNIRTIFCRKRNDR